MKSGKFIEQFMQLGLGEYLVLHVNQSKSVLGNLSYDKGKIYLKDNNLLTGIKPEVLKPCWDKGLVGMICNAGDKEWESLTYYGLEKCKLPVDLESTRHDILQAAENQYGEKLIDFEGSIYRGFNLLLKNHFLPVILLHRVGSKSGETGLAITDLRAASMEISLIQKIHNMVQSHVDKRMALHVEDTTLDSGDFENIFKQYLNEKMNS